MIYIKQKEECCGCSSCYNICPKHCIEMKEDNEGFLYPIINKEQCIECNLCEDRCPILNINDNMKPKVYGAYAVNKNIRYKSSSGGVFSLLSKIILDNGGVVYGAMFDEKFKVVHSYITSYDDIDLLRGSKYVQSDLSNIFYKIKKQLSNGVIVLFSGTPCQVSGLKAYLNKEYKNLYCLDIVCHGVPSPKIYKDYLSLLERKYKSSICNINFRYKNINWRNYNIFIKFKNGSEIIEKGTENIYMKGFLKDIYIRPSCTDCKFKNFRSRSDITIGDFWGINNIDTEFYNNEGVSLVCINTEQGLNLFERIPEKDFIKKEYSLKDAVKENPYIIKSIENHKNKSQFFDKYNGSNINQLVNRYTKISIYKRGKFIINNLKNRIKRLVKVLLGD